LKRTGEIKDSVGSAEQEFEKSARAGRASPVRGATAIRLFQPLAKP